MFVVARFLGRVWPEEKNTSTGSAAQAARPLQYGLSLEPQPTQRKPQRGAAEGRPPLWRRPKAASPYGWVCEGWVRQWYANGTRMACEWNADGTQIPKMERQWHVDPQIDVISGDK